MARLLPPERDIGVLRAPVRSSLALVGVFLLILLALALLDRIGVDASFAAVSIVVASFFLFALAALLAHSRRAVDFYVADRKISGAFGGLSGAGGFAGLLAVALAGAGSEMGANILLTALGLAAGYLLLASAIAPGLRGIGAYTPGDFFAARFGGGWARLAWAAVSFVVSFLLLLAHLKIATPLVEELTGLTPRHALYATAGLTVMAALPGGMRSLTWTQAIQYFVIALACLVPAVFLAVGSPAAEGAIVADLNSFLAGGVTALKEVTRVETLLPLLLAAIGAASIPHLTARTLTAQSGREAGTLTAWGVLFAALLVVTALVLARLVAGAAGIPAAGGNLLELGAVFAVLPPVLGGLVLAGMLAALFALGQAALFSAATAISHDLWDEILDRRGPEGRRIIVARLILVGVVTIAAVLVPVWPAEAPALLAWALALGAAGSFVPLVLGLWWRRCNEVGALGGIIAGFGFTTLVFLLDQHVIPEAMISSGWAHVGAPVAALAGLSMSLIVTVGLSLVTPAPEPEVQRLTSGAATDRRSMPVRERPA